MAVPTEQGTKRWNKNGYSSHPASMERCRHQSSVIVLGVMYPAAIPQPDTGTSNDLPSFPPDLCDGRQSAEVVFFDPLAKNENSQRIHSDTAPAIMKVPKAGESSRKASRRGAIEAVICDLAALSLLKRPQDSGLSLDVAEDAKKQTR